MLFYVFNLICLCLLLSVNSQKNCDKKTVTTTSGTAAPKDFCSGDLIFEENFNEFDLSIWEHEITLGGGGNWEFQWYTNNRSNSYAENGVLYIRPTLTADEYGESFLSSGVINLHGGTQYDTCTNAQWYGCERGGSAMNILNPVKTARIRTINSFAFKYGKVEIKAKIPSGDWLWPAIWFMPKYNAYGGWPASGEIDLLESRGNRNLMLDGINIGTEQISSTLHFAPRASMNAWQSAHMVKNSEPGKGWNNEFHRYQMEWTPDHITFSIDDIVTGTISAGAGFWARGLFEINAPGIENPWRFNSVMAPFDQEFYLIMNLAVGGVAYFPDAAQNPGGKPWLNNSPKAATDFWNGRNTWSPTWDLAVNNSKEASLQVDYVRVWAL